MVVRLTIDIAEDDLEKIRGDELLSLAFVEAVADLKKQKPLAKGISVAGASCVSVDYTLRKGIEERNLSVSFGYARYKGDQATVHLTGENGSTGDCVIHNARGLTPKK